MTHHLFQAIRRAFIPLLLLAIQIPAHATPTENNGLRVLPAPAHVVIDGKTDDWDLSAGIFCCDDVENQRDHIAVWLHAMYDKDYLYILARYTDETPLNNPGQTIADYGFAGDCLQFRVITNPGTDGERTSAWDCWKGKDGADVIQGQYGKRGKTLAPEDAPVKNAKTQGAQQAFTINPDGKGYVQEIAIPWKFLNRDGAAPAPGTGFKLTFEPNYTVGLKGRLSLKDLFMANVRPDRVFTFMAIPCWGIATIQPAPGPVTPQPVRLADAREFPVKMVKGLPTIDWTGLIKTVELQGFKAIRFTMPEDGFISLNIKAADGTVVRQLLNAAPYTKGEHEVKWDGLTNLNAHQPGEPVPAGTYNWDALFHKGIGLKLRGWACNAGSAPWDNGPTTNWGGDEGNPTATAADDTQVYLGWACAEAASALVACDLDGNVKWKNKHGGIAGVKAIAAADGIVYVMGGSAYGTAGTMDGGAVYKLKATDGDYVLWGEGSSVDLMVKTLWDDAPDAPVKADNIAARNGKLYLSFTAAGKILVLDGKSGKLLQTLVAQAPGALQVGSDGVVYAVSEGNSVVSIDSTGTAKPLISSLSNAAALAMDKDAYLYVGVGDPDNQVKVFDARGKPLKTIGRAGGRALIGPWTPDGMRFVNSLAVSPNGRLWAAEKDSYPRRISSWDTKTGTLVKEFFGSTSYGALGGAIDPLDPNIMVGQGCEWHLDPATGRSTCSAVITRDGMENSRFGIGNNGRLYLAVAPTWTHEMPFTTIFERTKDGQYKMRSKFYYEGVDPKTKRPTETRYWADIDGNGQEESEEMTTVPGDLHFSGWYMAFAPDLTFYSRYQQFKVTGFTPAGAPLYDLTKPVQLPHSDEGGGMGATSGMGSADGKLMMYNGKYGVDRGTFNVYDIASGKQKWSYPDNFVGVHGSHNATPAEIGMIRGAFDIAGTAKLPEPVGNIWVIPTNVGEWHILTGDGFYLTRLFEGDQLKVKWPPEAIPGADMSCAPCGMGGEDFGGSIAYGKDGRLYFQSGKTGFWNLEVTGLDTVKAISGKTIKISDGEVTQARALRESQMQTVVGKRSFVIKKNTPVLTGNFNNDFKGSEILAFQKTQEAAVRVAAAWDDQNLYIGWDVADETPWKNSAKAAEDMYVSGDTVDFQLGTDPKADKNRGQAVAGDLRISIGNFQNNPTAVIYRKVSAIKKPKTFSSGVIHNYPMDFVDVLANAKTTVKTRTNGYMVETVIPLSDLGLKPAAGLNLTGDFGVTHGDAGGTRTRLRTYWNNQHTGLVDDAVFELQMEPKNWGALQFAQ